MTKYVRKSRMTGKCVNCGVRCDGRAKRCKTCRPLRDIPKHYNTITIRGAVATIELRRRLNLPLFAEFDAQFVDTVRGFVWFTQWSETAKTFYVVSLSGQQGSHRQKLYLHRLITNADIGMQVDHRDHNGLNNRLSNLKVCTQAVNQQNRIAPRKGSLSGVRGVAKAARGKWCVRRMVNGRMVRAGVYSVFEEACDAARRLYAVQQS